MCVCVCVFVRVCVYVCACVCVCLCVCLRVHKAPGLRAPILDQSPHTENSDIFEHTRTVCVCACVQGSDIFGWSAMYGKSAPVST